MQRDQLQTTPQWPTAVAGRTRDGRTISAHDNSVWLYRKVPLAPVEDARNDEEAFEAAMPLAAALEGLAALPTIHTDRRAIARGNYRNCHLLLINIPRVYNPSPSKYSEHIKRGHPSALTYDRILLLGTKLLATVGTGTISSAVNSIVETMVSATTPMSDYDADYEAVGAVLARSGLTTPSQKDYRTADAWWNGGRFPDVWNLPHSDHIHYFANDQAARRAERISLDSCDEWIDMPGQAVITFATAQDAELPYIDGKTNPLARWALPLIRANAAVISMRFSLEPATVTRGEIRRQRKQYIADIDNAQNSGILSRQEHQEKLAELTDVEGVYATPGAPATLYDATIIAGFDGYIPDLTTVGSEAMLLNAMSGRQKQAWQETLMASSVVASPYPQDFPATVASLSGLPSLSFVGDKEGAFFGMSEYDRQAALVSPIASSRGDAPPIRLGAADTGAGKTVTMLDIADQFAEAGHPVIIFDPKPKSDHEKAVRRAKHSQVASLDKLASSDGILDPLRYSQEPEEAIGAALSMIMTVHPATGTDSEPEVEIAFLTALQHGLSNGATCSGQALRIAIDSGLLAWSTAKPVFDVAETLPLFRAVFGIDPHTQPLRTAEGITLIKVGNVSFDLPEPGNPPVGIVQKTSLAVVRAVVFGSMMALAERDGVLMLDEAWVLLDSALRELQRAGRIARSLRVLLWLWTQRVTDALKAGIKPYISGGVIGPLEKDEAYAACEIFDLEPTEKRITRHRAKATMAAMGAETTVPNWNSMRALRDPDTGAIIRGAIWTYLDLDGRAINVEKMIPADFLADASTNPDDIDARRQEAISQTV